MKTFLLSALLLATATIATSADTPGMVEASLEKVQSIGTFRVHRQGKNIVLNWSGVSSNVAYFEVERSWDGEYFDPLGDPIPNTHARTFRFTDDQVAPGFLYYRVVCYNEQGQECGRSAVEMIRIVQRK